MPTYDYICHNCGNKFEAFQNISAAPLTECPKCHGQVERKIGAGAGLMFKGSGFYITDYKNHHSTSGGNKQNTMENKAEKSKENKKAS